jgi:hypothetical protein
VPARHDHGDREQHESDCAREEGAVDVRWSADAAGDVDAEQDRAVALDRGPDDIREWIDLGEIPDLPLGIGDGRHEGRDDRTSQERSDCPGRRDVAEPARRIGPIPAPQQRPWPDD